MSHLTSIASQVSLSTFRCNCQNTCAQLPTCTAAVITDRGGDFICYSLITAGTPYKSADYPSESWSLPAK